MHSRGILACTLLLSLSILSASAHEFWKKPQVFPAVRNHHYTYAYMIQRYNITDPSAASLESVCEPRFAVGGPERKLVKEGDSWTCWDFDGAPFNAISQHADSPELEPADCKAEYYEGPRCTGRRYHPTFSYDDSVGKRCLYKFWQHAHRHIRLGQLASMKINCHRIKRDETGAYVRHKHHRQYETF